MNLITTPEPDEPSLRHRSSRVRQVAGSSRGRKLAGLGVVLIVGSAATLSACGGSTATATSSSTTAPAASSTTSGAATPGGTGANRGSFPGTFGTISTIGAASLTVKTAAGKSTTVTTTSATKVTVTTKGAAADLTNGATVRALGTVTGGVLAANSIEVGALSDLNGGFAGAERPGGTGTGEGAPTGSRPTGSRPTGSVPGGGYGGGGAARFTPITGTVSAITSGSFTLTESNGTAGEVTISSSTTITVIKSTTLSGLTVGQSVVVTGTTSASGTVAATSISQGNAGFGAGGFGRRTGGSTTTTS
jgi:hypothetical protein